MAPCRRLVLLVTPLLALAGCTPKGTPPPLLIGHVAPLSGPSRSIGEHARQGIDLAVEEANKDPNHVLNRPVNVLHVDSGDGGETASSRTAALLAGEKVVALLGGTDTAQLEQVARAAQSYDEPLVTPSTLPPSGVNDYVFSTAVAPAYQGQTLARFVREELKAASVLVLTDSRGSVSTTLAAAFIKEAAQGAAVHVDEWTYQSDAEWPDRVERVKKAKPAAVLVAGTVPDLVKLLPQLHVAAPEAALLAGVEEGALPGLAEVAPQGGAVLAATVFATEGLTPAGQEFAGKYHERFGQDLDVHAALAYDNARLLFDALRRAKTANGPQVREALGVTADFQTLTGPLSFTKDRSASRAVFIVRLEDRHIKMTKRYDPAAK